MVKPCVARCLLDAPAPKTLGGTETWVYVVVTRSKGLGRVCPEDMEEEIRKCRKECPAGAPNSPVGEQYCSLAQEVWTECSVDCMQERYLDEACEKKAEVRPCHVGHLCTASKSGLLLTTGLT
ncbi:unnamed protein product, partial [Laminaria digitata]